MSNEKVRRNFSPEEKVRLLKRHLVEREEISKLCEEYEIQPTQFYQWQKEFFERGAAAFEQRKTGNKMQSNAVHASIERFGSMMNASPKMYMLSDVYSVGMV